MGIMLSPYLAKLGRKDGFTESRLAHWCPACEELHEFACDEPQVNGEQWQWNGNAVVPTFTGSMNIKVGPDPDDGSYDVCHYFLKAGMIRYLADCTHSMASATVRLPAIPDFVIERIEAAETFRDNALAH